jgi:hypothetical protein
MEIKVYCERCKKYELIEYEPPEEQEETKGLGIPGIPSPSGGLTTLSVVHRDHILLIDVDFQGNVRGYRIIERIAQDLQKTIAMIVDLMFRSIKSTSDDADRSAFLFLTTSEAILKIFVGIYQQMMINLLDDVDGFIQITKGQCIFQYGHIVVTVGDFRDIRSIASHKTVLIFHLSEPNATEVIIQSQKEAMEKISEYHIAIFDIDYITSESGKDVLAKVMDTLQLSAVLDVSTPSHIADVIYHIFSKYL